MAVIPKSCRKFYVSLIKICSRVVLPLLYLGEHSFQIIKAHIRSFDRYLVVFHYPMCSIFPFSRNHVCLRRILLREGRFLCIIVWTYLCFTIKDSVLMYLGTISAFWASVNIIFPIFFRVKNLDVMCVRSRVCRTSLVHEEVLYDYYIDQHGRIIIFHSMTWIILLPIF